MKHKLIVSLLAALLGFGIPTVLEAKLPEPIQTSPLKDEPAAETAQAPPQQTEPSTDAGILPPTDGCLLIDVLLPDGFVTQLPLDEYLVGVLLAEMPPSFPQQAQMAQAVVARTYTLRRWSGSSKHEAADICTNPACCQAWISLEEYQERSGAQAAEQAAAQAAQAVSATDGQALFYDGSLIEATYFACSGGRTETAAAVWGSDIPYLQAVDSPGEEEALHYSEDVTFSREELREILESAGAALTGQPGTWFETPTYTEGGGVEEIRIGGVSFSGTELRQLLGLRSTCFTVSVSEDAITFHTLGNGHRVGMSQYGAKAMAQSGSSYQDILSHYYPGTELLSYPAPT